MFPARYRKAVYHTQRATKAGPTAVHAYGDGIEGTLLNTTKAIYDKSVASIISHGEIEEGFPLFQNQTRMPTFTNDIQSSSRNFIFNHNH